MHTRTRSLQIARWAIIGVMFVVAALAWPSAPDTIAVHWGLNGRPDRFGGKLEGLLALPVISLLVAFGLHYLPRVDPFRARYVEFASAYAVMCTAILAMLAGVYAVVLLTAFGVAINMTLVVAAMVGVLLIVIGSVLDQVRRNWFVGIRTPWTLSSERSWTATHRVGRWVFIAMGVCLALAGLLQSSSALIAAIVVCIAGVLGLVAYSYLVWRDDPARTV